MPVLDLTTDRRVLNPPSPPPPPVPSRAATRTLSPQNTPAVIGFGGSQGFAAAKVNRLSQDFMPGSRSADQDLFSDNVRLRARGRQLELDNPHATKFLATLQKNIPGPHGIGLQATVTNQYGKATADTDAINLRIETAWQAWCEKGSCTADGKFGMVDVEQMAIANIGREGENLVKFVYGRDLNACGFALQPLDNDQLDDTMMQQGADGSEIRMGVEVNPYRRPMAYHLWSGHPNDINRGGRERKRIPANLIVHTYLSKRAGQTRGYSWMAPVILSMNQYAKFEEATQVAARASAAKFMVITKKAAEGYTGDEEDEDNDAAQPDGGMGAAAGEGLRLEAGEEAEFIDPRFPTNTFEPFTRACLRNIATGLGLGYNTFANDLVGVNFSSIRAGMLDERDTWRLLQRWFIDHFLKPIFREWLRMALLTVLSDLTLTPAQQMQFAWHPRGWDWVDPQKDANATILKIGEGLTTRTSELAAQGKDFKTVVRQLKAEQDFLHEQGVVVGTDLTGDQGGKGVAPGDEKEAAEVNGSGTKGGK